MLVQGYSMLYYGLAVLLMYTNMLLFLNQFSRKALYKKIRH